MFSSSVRTVGLNQFSKATAQAAGGNKVTATFPSLKREWEAKAETFPAVLPAFANDLSVKKVTLGQMKKTFNLNAHLFNNKCLSVSGIGGEY